MAKFSVGDWADHKSGTLDPREVCEVSKNGRMIRLTIFGMPMSRMVRSADYDRLPPRKPVSGRDAARVASADAVVQP